MLFPDQGMLRMLQPMSDEDQVEAEKTRQDWMRHRMHCLDLAVRIGVQTAEQAIELAEKLGEYILRGKPDAG